MNEESSPRRRKFLAALGAGVPVGVAGCSSDDDTDDMSETTSEDTTDAEGDGDLETQVVPPDGVAVADRPIDRRIGSMHASPKYRFEEGDVLNEGARALEELGVSTIGVKLHDPSTYYGLSTDWPRVTQLRSAAEHEYYHELFRRDFDTYVVEAFAHLGRGRPAVDYFQSPFSEELAERITEEFRELGEYLLATFDGTGNEIVIQDWEIDAQLTPNFPPMEQQDDEVRERAKRWINARQQGIVEARQSVDSDVALLGAVEVIEVFGAMDAGESWVVNTVLPEMEVDLVGFSSHGQLDSEAGHEIDGYEAVRDRVFETLDYIESNAPEPSEYVRSVLGEDVRPVYFSEFGQPEVRDDYIDVMQAFRVLPAALEWGIPYAIYWQLYDNEVIINGDVRTYVSERELQREFGGSPSREDVVGWYLVDPNGDPGTRWYLFEEMLEDPAGFDPSFSGLVDIYQRFSGLKAGHEIELQYDTAVDESELNPAVPEDESRSLSLLCSSLELSDGTQRIEYDIGAEDDRIVFETGAYRQEQADDVSFRWLGASDKITRVHVLSETPLFETAPSKVTLEGQAPKREVSVTVTVDGTEFGTITIDGEARLVPFHRYNTQKSPPIARLVAVLSDAAGYGVPMRYEWGLINATELGQYKRCIGQGLLTVAQ